jgi:hypothetical protein
VEQSQITEYHYYITEHDISSTNSSDLSAGPRIFKVKPDYKWVITQSEGPFLSTRNLKRNSQIFKKLERTKGKRAQQIIIDKNIIELKKEGRVYAPVEKGFSFDFIRVIEHAVKGNVKNGKVSGVHFFDEDKVRIQKTLKIDDNGVFEAIFEFYDSSQKLWIAKENPSTFFPKSWSLNKLFHECNFAYHNDKKVLVEDRQQVFSSVTKSGISVRIVYSINGELKTIYPIID